MFPYHQSQAVKRRRYEGVRYGHTEKETKLREEHKEWVSIFLYPQESPGVATKLTQDRHTNKAKRVLHWIGMLLLFYLIGNCQASISFVFATPALYSVIQERQTTFQLVRLVEAMEEDEGRKGKVEEFECSRQLFCGWQMINDDAGGRNSFNLRFWSLSVLPIRL